jgi:nucleobase:cation symporter-1, NCS1 family
MTTHDAAPPPTDQPFRVETRGIEPIPEDERYGRPAEQFWVWCAANIGLLGIVYGVIVVSFGLNVWQALLAAVAGTVGSFALVGLVSLAGKETGAPTLIVSRAAFGRRGNALPNLVSYVSLVGWEIVLVALAVQAAEALLDRLGVGGGTLITAIAFVLVAGATIAVGLLGHATILQVQKWATYAFAALTVVFFALYVGEIDWDGLGALPSGSWLEGWIPAVSILAAGLGIGWINAAGDYSRYLPRGTSSRALWGWTTAGASIAPLILIGFGVLVAGGGTDLAASGNPVADLAAPLPTWFLVPYLLVAAGGLIAGAVLDIYSSGLNLLALGVRMERYKSVAIDGVLMILGNIYILFIADDFLGTFQGFLIALGVPLAAWAAIFLTDMALLRRGGYPVREFYRGGRDVSVAGVGAFLVATVVGLGLVTNSTFTWLGWWASGVFESSSLGLFVAFVLAALLYAIGSRFEGRGSEAPAGAPTLEREPVASVR